MNKQLILIEDDAIFTFLLQTAIKDSNLNGKVSTFNNGLKALEYFQKEYLTDLNYVLFLDLNMPVMNGWEFLKSFNSIADTRNCMVFILTSSSNSNEIESLLKNPLVTDFVTKPITGRILNKIKDKITDKFGE